MLWVMVRVVSLSPPPVVLTCSYMPVVCGELVCTIVCVILGTIQYQDSIPLLVAIASRASHLDAPGSPAQSLRLHSENSLAQYFEGLFQIRDAEGTGHIDAAKLRRLLEYSGMGFSETELTVIVGAMPADAASGECVSHACPFRCCCMVARRVRSIRWGCGCGRPDSVSGQYSTVGCNRQPRGRRRNCRLRCLRGRA